eukprot:scaffold7192_cov135-Isochrysis_galbana.AAC.1
MRQRCPVEPLLASVSRVSTKDFFSPSSHPPTHPPHPSSKGTSCQLRQGQGAQTHKRRSKAAHASGRVFNPAPPSETDCTLAARPATLASGAVAGSAAG